MSPQTQSSKKDLSPTGVLLPGDVVSLDMVEIFNLPRADWRGVNLPPLRAAVGWQDEKRIALLSTELGDPPECMIISKKRCNRALISAVPGESAVTLESGRFKRGDFVIGPAFKGQADCRVEVVAAIDGMIYGVDVCGREFMAGASKFRRVRGPAAARA